jgi:hypothetical protein
MSIDQNVLNSEPVNLLGRMYADEYAAQRGTPDQIPSMLNAIGACAGFAAQIAVWRELISPALRDPGDFLILATTKLNEHFLFGDAINLFLFATMADRLSFLSLAGGSLRNASELPDIGELARHVAASIGSDQFGRPRLPSGIDLPELPYAALTRTWKKAARTLQNCRDYRAGEWPALLGAVAKNLMDANPQLSPAGAVKILLEAAVPISKLDPAIVEHSGIPAPKFSNWSNRAVRPENHRKIVDEVRAAMPPMPPRILARAIADPIIGFANLAGERCEAIVSQDRASIGRLFPGRDRFTATSIPKCNILFLYCTLSPSGEVSGFATPLRDLIGISQAALAVIASELPADNLKNQEFVRSLARGDNAAVDLVITLNRNGEAFGRFFHSLFEMMLNGVSMPMAWVTLAPQGPYPPPDVAEMIFHMERGGAAFASEHTAQLPSR